MLNDVPFNRLTPAEAERLALLSEELGEAQQAIGKILRHGLDSRHPGGGPTNRESLELEVGHVMHATARLVASGDLRAAAISEHSRTKSVTVEKYLHHQG